MDQDALWNLTSRRNLPEAPIDQAIEGLNGVRTVVDDILIIGNGTSTAEAVKDHDAELDALLSRCRERGIKLNEGNIYGIHWSFAHRRWSKGGPVQGRSACTCMYVYVRRILGMTNYLAKFLPKLSDVSEPLRQLTRKEKEFHWSKTHDKTFNDIKALVSKPPLLKYYDPEKPLLLQCDASEKGLGVSLMQEGKPIAYASRALTTTETNYSQIEKELLAIVFGVERFHQYTYGRKVVVDSDHKPLETIFGKPLVSAPRRLQKMFMRLQLYNIEIQYKKGSEMYLADTLSRHFGEGQPTRSKFEEEIEQVPLIEEINQMIASEEKMSRLKAETGKDEVLQEVKETIQVGWPEYKNRLTPTVTNYFHIRDELVVQDGVILRGDRVVIPKTLRKETMEDLHSAHQGIESTLRRARESVYWPNMNSDVKEYISRCETCMTFPSRQQKEPLLNHKIPDRPWAKIGTDLFQFENKEYLVTVDYFSNFFEVDRLCSTTSGAVVKKLKGHIARYGIPDEIVSDNGPQFDSEEFQAFAQSYGFRHTRTSPHHPQSNGKAESAVKQAKKTLQTTRQSGNDFYLALLNIRSTPQEGHNSSPALRLMNRRTKTTLPTSTSLLKPYVPENTDTNIARKQLKQQRYYNKGAKELGQLRKGDRVKVQPFGLGKKKWIDGEVKKEVRPCSYEVEANSRIYITNRKHLRKCRPSQDLEVEEDISTPEIDQENKKPQGTQEEPKELQPRQKELDVEPAVAQEDMGYRTRSGRLSIRPVRFGDST